MGPRFTIFFLIVAGRQAGNSVIFHPQKILTGFTTAKTVILILLYDGPKARPCCVSGLLFQ